MALLLHIDTSSPLCSVALSEEAQLLGECSAQEPNAHASQLTLLTEELMRSCSRTLTQLNAVCLSSGPGSYTGLRIGSSTAKGLCYALDIPLIAVSTLEILARTALEQSGAPYACALIDARRMEAYTGIYTQNGRKLWEKACELSQEQLARWAGDYPGIVFTGNALPKIHSLLNLLNLPEYEHPRSGAGLMVPFAYEKWVNGQLEDIALFTPNYIKTWEEGQRQKGR